MAKNMTSLSSAGNKITRSEGYGKSWTWLLFRNEVIVLWFGCLFVGWNRHSIFLSVCFSESEINARFSKEVDFSMRAVTTILNWIMPSKCKQKIEFEFSLQMGYYFGIDVQWLVYADCRRSKSWLIRSMNSVMRLLHKLKISDQE